MKIGFFVACLLALVSASPNTTIVQTSTTTSTAAAPTSTITVTVPTTDTVTTTQTIYVSTISIVVTTITSVVGITNVVTVKNLQPSPLEKINFYTEDVVVPTDATCALLKTVTAVVQEE